MSRRVVEGVRGDHSPTVEVGGEHEGVPLDPVHGGQGLRLSSLLKSPEVVLRLVKLLGEVPVEVHIVGVVPPGPVVVAVPGPGQGVAVRVEGGQDVDLGVVDQPRDPIIAAVVEGEVLGEVDQHLTTDHLWRNILDGNINEYTKAYLVAVHIPHVLHHGLHQAPGLGVGAELKVDQVSSLDRLAD